MACERSKSSPRSASGQDRARLREIDHYLQVLWDLRRRELAGERVDTDPGFYYRYTVDPGRDTPGSQGVRAVREPPLLRGPVLTRTVL